MARKGEVETSGETIGQDKPRDMPSTGPARNDAPEIEIVDGPQWREKADMEAFMHEHVDVVVHETTDPNAEHIIQVSCNGRNQFFMRGVVQKVRRKFVAVLANAKRTRFTQQTFKDANGNDAIRNVPHTALAYPFDIREDQNPKGRAWLKQLLNSY